MKATSLSSVSLFFSTLGVRAKVTLKLNELQGCRGQTRQNQHGPARCREAHRHPMRRGAADLPQWTVSLPGWGAGPSERCMNRGQQPPPHTPPSRPLASEGQS